jgi:hypothetical protein
VNDFYLELKMLQVSLPTSSISVLEILKFGMDTNCYPNVIAAYRNLLTVPVIVVLAKKKFLKIEIVKELSKINYVAGKLEWLGYMLY